MSLFVDGEVDRIALSGRREIEGYIWHFTPVKIPQEGSLEQIRKWIWHNLEGRFSISTQDGPDWTTTYVVGFEDPTEASAFVMSLPLMLERDEWALA